MSPARRVINQILIPRLSRMVKGKVLFVGVDTKWDYRMFFQEYETLDINKKKNPDILGDIQKCPQIPDNTYDAVIMIGVWEFLKQPIQALNEIWRITKPGGKLLLCATGKSYGKVFLDENFIFDYLTGFRVDNIEFSYLKTKVPWYIHIFATK